ncbi:MAG TPA: hypothetical protein PK425_07720 [Syntrophales bacterium]|jgi:RNA recognition motif-containing protein|nr:hypothetical protein [Syntrophales bacterium]HPX56409.1 hypothetical protein [Syntrophales bacterium]HQA82354.1 hypothetical protein [Syntrophales bacterium]
MSKKLYIGNLSQGVNEEDLRVNFASVGEVRSVSIIKDRFTATSKGFGFVEMEKEEDATEAIKKFNGGELDGRTIIVSEARPKNDSRGRSGGSYAQNRGYGGGGTGRGRY